NSGLAMQVQANLHLKGFASTTRTGPPPVLVGNPSSIFGLEQRSSTWSLSPKLLLGDRLANALGFAVVNRVYQNNTGDPHFNSGGTLFRQSGGSIQQVLAHSFNAADVARLTLLP